MRPSLLLGLAAASIASALVQPFVAQEHGAEGRPTVHSPAKLQWKDGPPSLPPGARFVVLEGDPAAEGPFTMRVMLPDGYRIPPHTHPKTERITVIAGTFRLGMGEQFDEAKMTELPTGTYGFWPAGMQHYAAAKGETTLQLHGIGPWQIQYLNPADDPRKK